MTEIKRKNSREERIEKTRYLEGYYWNLENLKLIEDKIVQRKNRLYDPRSPIITDMPRGGSSKDLVDKISDKDEAVAELVRRLERCKNKKLEIESVISNVKDPRYFMLLQLRYMDNLSLDLIADRMSLSYSRVTKLHGLALDQVIISNV